MEPTEQTVLTTPEDEVVVDELTTALEICKKFADPNNLFQKDSGNAFKLSVKEISQEEVETIKDNITTIVASLDNPDVFEEAAVTLNALIKLNSRISNNLAIEEVVEHVISEVLARRQVVTSHITQENSDQNYLALELLHQSAKNSRKLENKKLAIDSLSTQITTVEQNLYTLDNRDKYGNIARYIISEADEQHAQAMTEGYSKALLLGEKAYRSAEYARFLSSPDFRLKKAGVYMTSRALEEYGLPGKKMVNEWFRASGDDKTTQSENIIRNISTIEDMENATPGISKKLNEEFGIANFGRYPIELLTAQYESINDTQKPYGILLFPKDDHNAAFHFDYQKLLDLQRSTPGYNLRIVECGTKLEVAKQLLKVNKKYGQIEFMVIGGHGTADSIQLGSGDEGTIYSSDLANWFGDQTGFKPKETLSRINSLFVPEPSIVLVSCSTANGQESIAKVISQFGARVSAPNKDTSLLNFETEVIDDKLQVGANFDKAETVIYVNGSRI